MAEVDRVHLVDGTFELFRCFHGALRHTNRRGEEVGAVRGLLHTLLSLLKQEDVSHVAVAFDRIPAARGDAGTDAGSLVRRQAPLAFDAVRALGIRLWPMVRYQADDALASGARLLGADARIGRVVICTSDTDLFQCIRGGRVVVHDRISRRTTDEDVFRARYGIAPWQFPDHLALVGAAAKGIPGVPHWGPKTAARFLGRYGGIESIPEESGDWPAVAGKERLAASFAARRDRALLVKRLATLRDDLPLDCEPATLAWRALDTDALREVTERADADDLWPRIDRWDRPPGDTG